MEQLFTRSSASLSFFIVTPPPLRNSLCVMSANLTAFYSAVPCRRISLPLQRSSPGASTNDRSYLDMWKNAVDRERKSHEFLRIVESPLAVHPEKSLEQRSEMFKRILDVSKEERDRTQRLQVIDRAAAAIAAARALLKDIESSKRPDEEDSSQSDCQVPTMPFVDDIPFTSQRGTSSLGTPGPDFWSWSPVSDITPESSGTDALQPVMKSSTQKAPDCLLLESEYDVQDLTIPWESTAPDGKHNPPLPPFQSFVEVNKINDRISGLEEKSFEGIFPTHAEEAADALRNSNKISSHGINADGTKWWRQTGSEERSDGVVCNWTLIRGVSADDSVEWEDKYWECSDQFDYKELGSEKSGRNAFGDVWREYWKESMWQTDGLITHIEKNADKWGKNGEGEEWQEKWWEHYDSLGGAEKWAHKWCHRDPNTHLDPGHAHKWHERWGEKYNGIGGSMKYTDKWAERSEGDGGWSKWGDKWDEHFGEDGRGVKQGETWWEGRGGERWNRTWGEGHNGSGWVHKYGRSSSGEHWDTHVHQDTCYEPHPHYGFELCMQNSLQLRAVRPSSHEPQM